MVGDDEIPALLVQGGLHVPRGVDPLAGGLVASAPQLPQQEQRVVFRILDEQHPEWHAHQASTSDSARAMLAFRIARASRVRIGKMTHIVSMQTVCLFYKRPRPAANAASSTPPAGSLLKILQKSLK